MECAHLGGLEGPRPYRRVREGAARTSEVGSYLFIVELDPPRERRERVLWRCMWGQLSANALDGTGPIERSRMMQGYKQQATSISL
jgi:hypothetical protein